LQKIIDWNPIGIRTKGRPKNSWRYEVINYLKKQELENWIQLVKDRNVWNDLVQNKGVVVSVEKDIYRYIFLY
jgi:hypothetical protein